MRILKIPYITESETVVYRIKASDADNDDIMFDVLEDYGKSLIRFEKINQNEANVILIYPLKKNDEYNLTIYANTNDESTYIESRLIATDVEQTSLKETNPFIIENDPIYIYENISVNNLITTIKAFEQEDSELPVTFELLDNDIFHFRYIFGPRGMSAAEIILLNQLDYEKQNLYILTILAINGRTNNEVDTRNVHQTYLTIVVKDVQDTPPKFDNLPQTSFIANSYRSNQTIFNVRARDGDVNNKRNLNFTIKKPNDKYFKINSNGSIWSPLSYDDLNQIYDVRLPIILVIEANEIVTTEPISSLLNDLISSQSQLIIVFDSNNRIPEFSGEELFADINEHSPYLASVIWRSSSDPVVFDLDYGFNGTFELSLIDPTNTFLISPLIGYRNLTFTLLVNDSDSLDYEKYHNLTVIIKAKDFSQKESLSKNVTCTIFINDINDNYPEFSQNRYHSSIMENAPEGTSIITIKAFDKDTGNYGEVRFTGIKGPMAQNFKIDLSTGTVLLVNGKNIDREMIEEIFVTIEARDNIGTGNRNTTELYIEILDANDNSPIFLQSYYLAILKNDLMEFVHPLKVDAIDIDQINTTNSIVNYEIIQGNYENMFIIDRITGKINVQKQSTLSTLPNYIILTVRAYDLGIPQMFSYIKIYIYILNNPTYLPTLFFTNQILDIRNENSSLERTLSLITGGNVTVKELKSPETANEPITIVTVVKYQNENFIDLDNLAYAYQNLFYTPPTSIDSPSFIEKIINQTQAKNLPSESSSTDFNRGFIKTAENNILDIFLNHSEKIEPKNMWYLQRKKNTIRPYNNHHNLNNRKRRIKRNENKTVAIRENQQMATVNHNDDWFQNLERRFQSSGEDIEYEIKEEKKYSTTPKTMSYYVSKKIIRPKMNESKEVDILNLENKNVHSQNQLFHKKKIQSFERKNLTFDVNNNDNEENNQQNIEFENLSNTKQQTNYMDEKISFNHPNHYNKNNLNFATKSENIQRKSSIFCIAYNGIHNNRENISSESDKTLYKFEK